MDADRQLDRGGQPNRVVPKCRKLLYRSLRAPADWRRRGHLGGNRGDVPPGRPRLSRAGGPNANSVSVGINRAWLAALPDSAFPIIVDPTLLTDGSQFIDYKSDGNVCGPCPIQVGNPNEPSRWVEWRGVVYFPYESLW